MNTTGTPAPPTLVSGRPPRGGLRREGLGWRIPLVLAMVAPFAVLPALAAPPRIVLETTFKTAAPPAALAINVDETLVASAGNAEKDAVTVSLRDRLSGTVLGQITGVVGDRPSIAFSPMANLLLLGGSKKVQLWEVPLPSLKPSQPLSMEFLRWEVALKGDAPTGTVAFGVKPHRALWSAGRDWFQRGVAGKSPFDDQPAWSPPNTEGDQFVTTPGKVAVFGKGSKAIALMGKARGEPTSSLEGHRFPVVAARFSRDGVLVSLDEEGSIFQWGVEGQPRLVTHLKKERGKSTAGGIFSLHPPFLLVKVAHEKEPTVLVLDTVDGRFTPGFPVGAEAPVAVSPTGRYILAATGTGIQVYGFSAPMDPADYAETLKKWDAPLLARHYATMLDLRGLSPNTRTRLQEVLAYNDSRLTVGDLLVSLETAAEENDPDRMTYWAEKVLALEANHPKALAILARVRNMREEQLLDRARQAQQLGEHKQVIALLATGVGPESPHYQTAQQLIRESERIRAVATIMEQAREQLNLGNFPSAKTLAGEALRKDPANPAALSLREEAADRAGALPPETMFLLAALALGATVLGGGMYRFRHTLVPVLRKFSIHEHEPAWNTRTAQSPSGTPQPKYTPPPKGFPRPSQSPPRPDPATRQQRKEIERVMEEIEDLIRLSRQADRNQQHTSFLMELEAELNAINRRLDDRSAELFSVKGRLGDIQSQLKRLKFGKPNKDANFSPGNTYYDVLNLPGDANPSEIKAAYHKMVKEYHPDLHSGSDFGWIKTQAETMSKKISEAYEVLSNPEQRKKYDQELVVRTRGGR